MITHARSRTGTATLLLIVVFMAQNQLAMTASLPQPLQLQCPPSVPVFVAPSSATAAIWKPYVGSELYLNSAAPIDGPPEKRGELAAYSVRPGKKEWSYTYDLDAEFPEGIWLECGYGTHDEVTLAQRMPDTIKACTFTYRKGQKAGQHHIKISCH